MTHESLRIIRDEHAALAAMLRSLSTMVQRGSGDLPGKFFDVLRAMLFYIGEFPERLHHPKETELLFPKVAKLAPQVVPVIERLEKDHMQGESAVRELQHHLLARDAKRLTPRRPITSGFTWSTCYSRKGKSCPRRRNR